MGQQDHQRTAHVHNRHERHHHLGDLADPLDAADQHQKGDRGHHHASEQLRHSQGGFEGQSQLVGLHAVANAEARQGAEQGEQGGQPAPARPEAIADEIHRAAHVLAELIHLAVVNGQHGFGVLGGHAHKGDQPHPEHGAGATGGDRARHSSHVARADRGRQGGGEALKGTHIPFPLAAADRGDGLPETEADPTQGHETKPEHQIEAGETNQPEGDRPPHHVVEGIKERQHIAARMRRWCHQNAPQARGSSASKRNSCRPAGVSPKASVSTSRSLSTQGPPSSSGTKVSVKRLTPPLGSPVAGSP